MSKRRQPKKAAGRSVQSGKSAARPKIVKTHHAPSFAPDEDDAIAQFSPQFAVYLLPPDTVCLYSEDRKFLLHGALYCAAATAIAEGGKSFRDVTCALAQSFPPDKIREALKRLVERRYVMRASRSSNKVTTAYWASLGLLPEIAEANFEKCRVGIRSIELEGTDELASALSDLGVRIVKRSPDLTVTLVNDYLDPRLAEMNERHLSANTSWVLAQPSGIFPLVGPVFRPGEGACWTCLAERMKRNREVRALLARREARCLAVSPLAGHCLGQSGISLAALEIAKAIASDFRTPLRDHIFSLDLMGSSVVKHYVGARPQCPSCGYKKLRDPRRTPAPVELGSGGKVVMTSGGYRSVSPATTVARFRKLVSPLTGVVSRLERIEADLPLNTNYRATHNFSGPSETINELRMGLSAGSFGKGSTAEQGEASALMEAIERYSGIFQGDEIRVTRRQVDFAAGESITPNEVLLFSEAQLREGTSTLPSPANYGAAPALFDRTAKIEWSPVWSLRDQCFKYLPTGLLYFFYRGPAAFAADSNGCAAGNTLEEAIVQGFLELVERDSYAIWWYNRLQRPQVDLSLFEDSYIRELQKQLAQTGRRLWVLDVTSDLGIPTFVAITHWMQNGRENIEFGSGAHFDARIAMLRALTELNQFLSLGLMGGGKGEKSSLDGVTPLRLEDYPYLMPGNDPLGGYDCAGKFGHLDTRAQVMACVELAEQLGLDFLVLDQTRPDIEVPVVRVIVPGLRHFYRRFAPGRLYEVPVKLGWRELPLGEGELNPVHPHT